MTRHRQRHRKQPAEEFPGWVWMLFGLAIGLSVALVIYVNHRAPLPSAQAPAEMPAAAAPAAVDDNGETAPAAAAKPRFDFYNMLPKFEVVIPEQEPHVSADTEPQAIMRPGVYVLQAGSFTRYEDADRRRAELALQGIESRIQRVSIDDKTYHRVRIGPIDDLDELNILRNRLRQAKIDVLRIRLGD